MGPELLDPFIVAVTVFVLSVFLGYYVIWGVTAALHSPLMSVTNAISSVIIVGALLTSGSIVDFETPSVMAFLATTLAAINIFGGFLVTYRMLAMFKKNK